MSVPTWMLVTGGLVAAIQAAPAAAPPAADYSLVRTLSLPGDMGWDCLTVDTALERLFLTHGDRVQAVDLATGKLAGTVAEVHGAHAVALVPDRGEGYASAGKDTAVVIFDLRSSQTKAKVKVTGLNPDLLLFDPASDRVFAFNGGAANATVLDPRTHGVTATLPLGGKPEFAVADGHGRIYVNLEDKGQVAVVDGKTAQVLEAWPLAPGAEPTGLALDPAHGLLLAACGNHLAVALDTRTGKVVDTARIGGRVDGAAFDPALSRAYFPSGEGHMTVIRIAADGKLMALGDYPTRPGARTIALDGKTHHLFLPMAEMLPAPEPAPGQPKARPRPKPGSFAVLELAPKLAESTGATGK